MDILSEKLDELSRSFSQEQAASSRAVEDLLKKLADLEKANERLLRTTENQDTLIAVLQEQLAEVRSQQNNLTDLVQRDTETLHALVDDQAVTFKDKTDHLEELYQGLSKNEENQENELSVLRGELQNLTRRVQTEERSRANSAENLQTQMDGISKTLRTQTDAADQATRSLQGRVGTLESRTTRGEATVSELQGQTEELKTLSEKLQKTAAFHTFLDKRDVTAKKPIAFNLLRVVGGGYDSDTGIYTAPFSGWYAFHVQLFPHSSADKDIWMDLYHNSEKVARGVCHQKASGGSFTCRTGITMHVTSGDTLWVQSFYGGPYWVSPFDNFFSGVLVRPD
nr:hypothetical protein BaRGS_014332 [Batillaria attramentaria]